MQIYLITTLALLFYLTVGWFIGSALHLQGSDLWVLRIGLSVIGIAGAAVYLWFHNREQKQAKGNTANVEAGSQFADIDLFLKNADSSLRSSRLGRNTRIRNMPALLVMGESSSAKTTIVLESGLQLEQIAGQVSVGSEIIPTEPLNCWFTEGTILLEVGTSIQSDPKRWKHLLKNLNPSSANSRSAASRAVLFCCSLETLLNADKSSLVALARSYRAQLEAMAEMLGIRVPVYILFTKSDSVAFFKEYVNSFANAEVEQVLGVTLPIQFDQTPGMYADRTTQLIEAELHNLTMGFADLRPELLERERSAAQQQPDPTREAQKLSGVYEFPREFRKLHQVLVEFLVEICKPSQLKIGPFLRGFYFSGVRAVASNGTVSASIGMEQRPKADLRATRIMRPGSEPAPANRSQNAMNSGRVPQWTFIRSLFKKVLLRDIVASDASRVSLRTNVSQRAFLAVAAAIMLIVLLGMTISFFGNKALLREVSSPIEALGTAPVSAAPSVSDMTLLGQLASTIRKLDGYEQAGVPWRLRWGLYSGENLRSRARRAYFDRFNQLVLQALHRDVIARFKVVLPGATSPSENFKRMFDALKVHLMLTSNREKIDPGFLPAYLLDRWTESHSSNPDIAPLVKDQLDFLTQQLKQGVDVQIDPDEAAVGRARAYLREFGGADRIYQSMLVEAEKASSPIQFNQRFPGSAEVVLDNYAIRGAFTKDGWKYMQDALQHPDRFFGGEQWVLGEAGTTTVDAATTRRLRDLYVGEFIAKWRQFLKSASLVPFRTPPDAALKLRALGGGGSPLLALFFVASDNTAIDAPEVKRAFQPVQFLVTPGVPEKFVNPANQAYMSSLVQLQLDLEQVVAAPPGLPVDPVLLNKALASAQVAKVAARQLGQNFNIDSEEHIEKTIQSLLEDPIAFAEKTLKSIPSKS